MALDSCHASLNRNYRLPPIALSRAMKPRFAGGSSTMLTAFSACTCVS